jgi:tetratricopeptide (TPR) repeat protein
MTMERSELQKMVSLGKDLARARQYEKAEDIFLKVLRKHKLADVYNALGTVYADQGKFNFAEVAFKSALKLNPQYMEAALNLSVVYNNLGLGKQAKSLYKKLKAYGAKSRGAMDPLLMAKIANMHSEIGDLYHSVGEYKLAIQAFEQALDLCPNFIDIQTKLATVYRESGDSGKALKLFAKAKKGAGRYAPFWISLGVTHYARNNRADAKKAWKKALSIEPRNSAAKAYAGLL